LDTSLVERARDGDLAAFEMLVEERMAAVYRLSLAIVTDEADARDVVQETFVAAWRHLPRLRDVDRFEAWFGRLVVNQARMALRARRRRRVREIPAREILSASMPFEDPADDARRLGRALRRLPIEQRSLLAMHHLEGRPLPEIADVFAIPLGTVKSRLFAARRALTRALVEDEG